MFASNGEITPPTMWQTAGFQVRARWAWCVRFHAKDYLHGHRPAWLAMPYLPHPGESKALRCQAITVAVLTMKMLVRHSLKMDERQTHRIRSVMDSFGLFTDRCRTPS